MIGLLVFGTLFASMPLYIYGSTLPPYALSLGASLTLVGVISGSYGVFQFLLRIPIGVASDHLQRPKLLVVFGHIGGVVACLGLLLSTDPRTFVIWRAIAGFGAMTHGIIAVLFAAQFDAERMPRAMALFSFTLFFAGALGPLIGGQVAQMFGWLAPFAVGAGIGVVGLVALSMVPEPYQTSLATHGIWHRLLALSAVWNTGRTSRDVRGLWRRMASQPAVHSSGPTIAAAPKGRHRLSALLRNPSILQATVLMAIISFTQNTTAFTFIPVVASELGAERDQLGLLTFLTMTALGLASLLSGNVVASRLSGRWTTGLGFILAGFSTLALPLIRDLPGLFVAQLAMGAGLGLGIPMVVTWALEAVAKDDQGAAASICLTASLTS